jgi:hypothetical protein
MKQGKEKCFSDQGVLRIDDEKCFSNLLFRTRGGGRVPSNQVARSQHSHLPSPHYQGRHQNNKTPHNFNCEDGCNLSNAWLYLYPSKTYIQPPSSNITKVFLLFAEKSATACSPQLRGML